MAEYLAPGVYVEEYSSGIKSIEGVSTSTAGFVGMTERGPVRGTPEFVGSFGEFQRIFGGYLPESYGDRRFLPMAVEQFFSNGGSRCFIVRLLKEDGTGKAGTAGAGAAPEAGGGSAPAAGTPETAVHPAKLINAAVIKGEDGGPGNRTGLWALADIPEVSIVVAPGVTENAEVQEIITHCSNMQNRVCILDMPAGVNQVTALKEYRMNFTSSFAAMYHPWIQVFDPLLKKSVYMPPSGAMAGVYARTDNTRGVFKAPTNEVIRSCTGLETLFGKQEQDMLGPLGINLIRNIPGQGFRVWGARTLSDDSSWKYINVRRLLIYIEETIRRNTAWAVFEPNDQHLWTKVRGSIVSFLGTLWRDGALFGASESEAYFVNIGKGSTMTDDDILNGRLICVIGVAPVRPAEFVIFRITQIMEQNG